MNKCVRLLALVMIVAAAVLPRAHAALWERGTLYNLDPSTMKKSVTVNGSSVNLADVASADPSSCFTITELSGSWRVINPFAGVALRTSGDVVAAGEVNGSDEAQLWLIEPGSVKGGYILIPANRPDKAAKAMTDGSLTLIDRTGASTDKAANFIISEANRKGFDLLLIAIINSGLPRNIFSLVAS